MLSPVADRPGLLIRDRFRYSDATLIIPPPLIPGLLFFDGTRTEAGLAGGAYPLLGSPEIGNTAGHLLEALSQAGFLEDETYANLKQGRLSAFVESPVRQAAHAGSAYPGGNRAAAEPDAAVPRGSGSVPARSDGDRRAAYQPARRLAKLPGGLSGANP